MGCWPSSCTDTYVDFSREVVFTTSEFVRECCVLGPGMYVDYNVLMCSLAHFSSRNAASDASGTQFASAAELRALIQKVAMPTVVQFHTRFSPFTQPWPPRRGGWHALAGDDYAFVEGIALKDGRLLIKTAWKHYRKSWAEIWKAGN